MATAANDHNNFNDRHDPRHAAREALRDAMMSAMAPLVIEALGLLTDAVKELRAQLQDDAIARRECAPLRRQLNHKRLQAELEDFEIERSEAKAEREERAEERKAAAIEREERAAQIAHNREKRAHYYRSNDGDLNGHDTDSSPSFL